MMEEEVRESLKDVLVLELENIFLRRRGLTMRGH